jgi:hypothetical protein
MPDLPGHDRREDRRRARRHERRLVRDGDSYTEDELERGEVELEEVPRRDEPPVDVQGEPWNWTKGPPYPRGYPGPDQSRDDPGPYDGGWDPPEVIRNLTEDLP